MVNQLASKPVSRSTGILAYGQTNAKLFREARRYLVGGVNSPVRSFKAVGGYPVFIKEGRGSKVYGECGREFIDYCLGFGALILGHAHPEVKAELKKATEKGSCFGAPTKLETELAKLICTTISSIEKIRLTNSGTEAVMGALRLARAYTKKDKIIKFAGGYHGHTDYLFSKHTLVCPYNDMEKVEKTAKKHKEDLAAIIVEPVAGNMGVVLPHPRFLAGLRELCDKYNLVLIFDEVITGFRLTYGGAQDYFKIRPDLTCLGKIIGGGLPVGAFGGKKEIMQLLAPEGEVYQAGTFSGNPLTISAGLATLKILSEDKPYQKLEKLTKYLCEKMRETAEKYGIKIKVNSIGSMFSIFFVDKGVLDYNIAKTQDINLFKKFYYGLLKRGIYLSPSPFETNFLSCEHTQEDIEKTVRTTDKVFSTTIPLRK